MVGLFDARAIYLRCAFLARLDVGIPQAIPLRVLNGVVTPSSPTHYTLPGRCLRRSTRCPPHYRLPVHRARPRCPGLPPPPPHPTPPTNATLGCVVTGTLDVVALLLTFTPRCLQHVTFVARVAHLLVVTFPIPDSITCHLPRPYCLLECNVTVALLLVVVILVTPDLQRYPLPHTLDLLTNLFRTCI